MAEKYSGRLFPVEAGQLITISGKTNNAAARFDIDLAGARMPGDIPFHISVRFNENVIIRNSLTKGVGWGTEERQNHLIPNNSPNPIRKGFDFKITIFIDTGMFYVSLDDKPFCYFPHRQPLSVIQRLIISKDVESIFQVDHITATPNRWPALNASTFSALVPKTFTPGSVIVFSATPRGNKGDFCIDFRETGSSRILFHLRPYLSQGSIVINDQDASKNWRQDTTVKPHPFPIVMDQKFVVRIGITNQTFMVAVNGRNIATFPIRDGSHKIFSSATGIEVIIRNGLRLEVQSVDHATTGANCHGFENFSY